MRNGSVKTKYVGSSRCCRICGGYSTERHRRVIPGPWTLKVVYHCDRHAHIYTDTLYHSSKTDALGYLVSKTLTGELNM